MDVIKNLTIFADLFVAVKPFSQSVKMGVAGLLPFVDKAMTRRHLRSFKGSVVAVDASIWICRAAYAIPSETAVLAYILRRIKLLQDNGCIPLLVFDGLSPSSKNDELLRRAAVINKLLQKKKDMREEDEITVIKQEQIEYDSNDDDDDEEVKILTCIDNGQDVNEEEADGSNDDDEEFDVKNLTDLLEEDGEEENEIMLTGTVSYPLPLKNEIDQEEQDWIIASQVQTQKDEEAQIKEIETGDEIPDQEIPLVSSKARRTFAVKIMEVLEKLGVPFLGSPAESDPQIAWLAKNKIVDLVITDDSDLILYGCPKVSLSKNFV